MTKDHGKAGADYRRRYQREQRKLMLGLHYAVPHGRPTDAEVRALQRLIPDDTRCLTSRICGDPLPGRSALERRGIAD